MAADPATHWPISLTNGAGSLVNMLVPLALVRLLSPDDVGRYKLFFLYITLGPGLLLTSGLTNGLYHWAGRYPESRLEIRRSWTWMLAAAVLLPALAALAAGPLAAASGVPPADLRLMLLAAPPALVGLFFEDLLIARGDVWAGAWYSSGFGFLRAVALMAAAWWARSVEAVLWAFFVTAVLRAAVGALLLAPSGDITPTDPRRSGEMLAYAVPVSLAALATLAFQHADALILSSRLSAADFAFYSMGCLVVPPLLILETSVNRVLIPRLAKAFAEGRPAAAAGAFREAVAELYACLMPAALGLAVFADPIVEILFTARYAAAADYLRVFSLSYVLLAFPHDAVARARADGAWILRTTLCFAPLSILVTLWAAARWGAMGALGAVLAARLLRAVYAQGYHRRRFGRPWADFLPLGAMAGQAALALAAAQAALRARALFGDPVAWLLTAGPLFAAACFAGARLFGARRPEAGRTRVVELAQTLCLGGLEKLVCTLATRLHDGGGFEMLVVSYDHPVGTKSWVPRLVEAGVPCTHWQKDARFSPESVVRLAGLLLLRRAHIVHAHDLGPLVYGSLAKLLTLGRVRLILTVHSLLDLRGNPRRLSYFMFFLRFADRIVTVSEGMRAGLVALGVDAGRIEVVPNGATFPDSRPDPAVLDLRRSLLCDSESPLVRARWLLCLSRLHPGKGQEVVLDVWEALPDEVRARLALFFVGQPCSPSYLARLQRLIAGAPRRERIVLLPPSERPQDWLSAADIFISGSSYEAMPLAPLEAAGSGVATVLSDIEGHRFLGGWAAYFEPSRPEEGARRVVDLLDAMDRRGEAVLREERWRLAEPLRRRWGSPAMAASYAEIFESVRGTYGGSLACGRERP